MHITAGGPWTHRWHGPTKTHLCRRENVPAFQTWEVANPRTTEPILFLLKLVEFNLLNLLSLLYRCDRLFRDLSFTIFISIFLLTSLDLSPTLGSVSYSRMMDPGTRPGVPKNILIDVLPSQKSAVCVCVSRYNKWYYPCQSFMSEQGDGVCFRCLHPTKTHLLHSDMDWGRSIHVPAA